ncbi:MAG: HflC protein [Candidatus Cloacimonetes bacterium 4572_55]|nr:MAG: HflC protein [Candidatus Cloacimonetes bacterium 4572_55]
MKSMNPTLILIGLFILLFAFYLSVFTINETEQVVITQFGKPIGEPIMDPGLHWKIPFVQVVHAFEKRFLEWDGDPNQVPTKDKRFIWVDTTARWQIIDPLQFFKSLGDERIAHSRLDDILDGEIRNAVAKQNLVELVRSSNREPDTGDSTMVEELSEGDQMDVLKKIRVGREKIQQEILSSASKSTVSWGVELLDFRIKRLNYVDEVREKVYARMISERKRIADKYRSEGQGEASRILGEKDRELKRIQSEAYKEYQEITGKADAEAARIYAEAYNRSPESRDFYGFIKSMETMETAIDKETWLMLSSEGDFYRYLQNYQ